MILIRLPIKSIQTIYSDGTPSKTEYLGISKFLKLVHAHNGTMLEMTRRIVESEQHMSRIADLYATGEFYAEFKSENDAALFKLSCEL